MSREKKSRNDVIALSYYKGVSVRELGRKHKRSVSTIHTLVARFRKRFNREQLENAEINRRKAIMRKRYGKK